MQMFVLFAAANMQRSIKSLLDYCYRYIACLVPFRLINPCYHDITNLIQISAIGNLPNPFEKP